MLQNRSSSYCGHFKKVATFRGNVLLAFFVIKNIVIKYVSSRETYKQKEQEFGGSCSFF
jgi:hypothetical protein